MGGRDIPASKLNYLQVLREVNQPDVDFKRLAAILQRDVSLSYKLLKLINSAHYGMRHQIQSLQQALVLLGIVEIKKWVSLLLTRGLGEDKPNELVINSLCRARFAELLAPKVGLRHVASELFLMGLFSHVDAMMDRRMPDLLGDLPLSESIKEALLNRRGPLGEILTLLIDYERGDWPRVGPALASLGVKKYEAPPLFESAVQWAHDAVL
jgi:EAL and modified HD-GYP domain-containing signal transduction protein